MGQTKSALKFSFYLNPKSILKNQVASLMMFACFQCSCGMMHAQATVSDSIWWPHPIWGADDQAGASNWMTPDKVLDALQWVKQGKVYELGHPYNANMPMIGKRSFKLVIPSFPTAGPFGTDSIVFNDEYVATEIGQVGTQFDGPGHVGRRMTREDGGTTEIFYNGFTSEEIKSPYGLKQLGVEHVKPYLSKAILLDLAGALGQDMLPRNYEIQLEDVYKSLKNQSLSIESIRPGDVLLFNTGWWRDWPNPKVLYQAPYVSEQLKNWIIERQPSMIGSDCTLDGPDSKVHLDVIMKQGIWNLEWMQFEELLADRCYEFMFVFTPLRLTGATGSPGRPIAIR